MLARSPPAGIYALADHLDGALAAGEDLLAVRLAPVADLGERAPEEALGTLVGELRRYEAAMLLHLLQARRRAGEITGGDAELRAVLRLIANSTDALMDLVSAFDPQHDAGLAALADVQQFLRRRGIIAEDQAALSAFQAVQVGDRYRIGGVAELGPMLDMVASALDHLDHRFDLYAERETPRADDAVAPAAPSATAGEPAMASGTSDAAGQAPANEAAGTGPGPAVAAPEARPPASPPRSLSDALSALETRPA